MKSASVVVDSRIGRSADTVVGFGGGGGWAWELFKALGWRACCRSLVIRSSYSAEACSCSFKRAARVWTSSVAAIVPVDNFKFTAPCYDKYSMRSEDNRL